jgi:hypothetical protein
MKVIAEYNNGAAPSSPSTEYIYAGSSLLATIAGTTTTYHHPDHLSVRLTTDANGNVVGQQAHYPFGESWYATGSTTKWQFTGYERDSESSNDYATARCAPPSSSSLRPVRSPAKCRKSAGALPPWSSAPR